MSGLRFLDGTLEKMKNDCNKFNLISQRMQNLCSPSILWNFKNALFSILDVGIAILSDAFGFFIDSLYRGSRGRRNEIESDLQFDGTAANIIDDLALEQNKNTSTCNQL